MQPHLVRDRTSLRETTVGETCSRGREAPLLEDPSLSLTNCSPLEDQVPTLFVSRITHRLLQLVFSNSGRFALHQHELEVGSCRETSRLTFSLNVSRVSVLLKRCIALPALFHFVSSISRFQLTDPADFGFRRQSSRLLSCLLFIFSCLDLLVSSLLYGSTSLP